MNNSIEKRVVEISMSTVFKTVFLLLLILGIYYIRNLVGVVLFALVVASAMEPAVSWFERKRIPRALSVLLIYVIVFLVLATAFYLVVPNLVSEVSSFATSFPSFLEDPVYLEKVFKYVPFSGDSLSPLFSEVFVGLQEKISTFTGGFLKVAIDVFGGAMSFLLMMVLSFYFAVQKNALEVFLRIVTPVEYESYVLNLWQKARGKIGRWMQGQILLGILVGILVFLGLTILRVEYALSFAVLAAIFELMPIFGPILASLPPIFVAFLQDPKLGLAVFVLFLIIQQFENHLIYPLVVRKIVGVPPILVILSIITGGTIAGFFGILLAIPFAIVLTEVLNYVTVKKNDSKK